MLGVRSRVSAVVGSLVLGLLLTAAPTSAMTDLAEFDGTTHPEVVALHPGRIEGLPVLHRDAHLAHGRPDRKPLQ
jgi:hypothetical protein